MSYCKHCGDKLSSSARTHSCRKVGLLDIDEDDSFIVSAIIGNVTGSGIVGGILGGDLLGGILGDVLDDDDGDSWFF